MSLTLDLNSTYGEPPAYLTNFLMDGSSTDMLVDGSSTPVEFSYTCNTKYAVIGRILLFLEDNTAFSSDTFGALAALTNGVDIYVNDVLLTNWKTNTDIALEMFDISNAAGVFGKSDRYFMGRWTFYKAVLSAHGLLLPNGGTIKAIVNDDLTSLVHFQIKIQGAEFNY